MFFILEGQKTFKSQKAMELKRGIFLPLITLAARIVTTYYPIKVNGVETTQIPATNNRFLQGIVTIFVASSHFFRSEYAQFGIRAACATLAGTIPAFLLPSYNFFTLYRGVWITITVVLGMSPTTGASISGLAWRCVGTVIGGLAAMATWYVVVGHVAGVIVFSFVVTAIRIPPLFRRG
jgi:uncharacterized membrane protein YccC